jgi:hypothetical protein
MQYTGLTPAGLTPAGLTLAAPADADVIYIGYPKAASTFVRRFLDSHPEVTTEYALLARLLYAPSIATASPHVSMTEKPCSAKIHVSIDESVAESICLVNQDLAGEEKWSDYRFVPDAWDKIKDDVVLDPAISAARLQKVYPRVRVLLLIREQTDWLNSAYKHYLRHLPSAQRTFADFCTTPQGIACLQAGHFDQTIRAYIDVFGSDRVRILRFDDIVGAPKRFAAELCAFIGVSEQPIPQTRENEANAQVARIRRRFPIIDRLPPGIKSALKPYAGRLPGGRGVILSSREIRVLRSFYATSNQRTDKLLGQLAMAVR